jgi:hypothetical protein
VNSSTALPDASAVTVRSAEALTPLDASVAVIVVEPGFSAVTTTAPQGLGVKAATPRVDDVHVAVAERFRVLPSVYVPVATKDCVMPTTAVAVFGARIIATSAGAETVSGALPETPVVGSSAVIVTVPVAVAAATPFEPAAFETVASALLALQVTDVVTFCDDPSLYVPVAVKGCCVPTGMLAAKGLTAIERRTALVTVREVPPLTPVDGSVADTVAEPRVRAVTAPAVPVAFDTATTGLDDAHVAEAVRFIVVPSEYVPVAVSDSEVPRAKEAEGAVTWMPTNTAWVTVTTVEAVMPVVGSVALTVVAPATSADTRPWAFDT